MKKIFLGALMLCCFNVFSQNNFETTIRTMSVLDCKDVSNSCSVLFVKFIQQQKIDSAKNLLKYWSDKCGYREPIQRAKFMLAIKEKSINDTVFDSEILNHVFCFRNRFTEIKKSNFEQFDYYSNYFGYVPFMQMFDKFSFDFFRKVKDTTTNKNSLQYCLSDFYSGDIDSIFYKVQSRKFKGTPIDSAYFKIVQKSFGRMEGNMYLGTGIWIPTGKLNIVGVHPTIGFAFGGKKKRLSFDVVFDFKFLQAENYYLARRLPVDTIEKTNHFFGGYFGIEGGYDIFSSKKYLTQIVGGIAYDGFDVFKSENNSSNSNQKSQNYSTNSYNINLGIAERFYPKGTSGYIEASLKYNFVDYTLNHLINLTGNAITFKMMYGFCNNVFKNNTLKTLDYPIR